MCGDMLKYSTIGSSENIERFGNAAKACAELAHQNRSVPSAQLQKRGQKSSRENMIGLSFQYHTTTTLQTTTTTTTTTTTKLQTVTTGFVTCDSQSPLTVVTLRHT